MKKHNTSLVIDPYFLQSMDWLIERGEFNNRSEIIRHALKVFLYEREKLAQIQASVAEIAKSFGKVVS